MKGTRTVQLCSNSSQFPWPFWRKCCEQVASSFFSPPTRPTRVRLLFRVLLVTCLSPLHFSSTGKIIYSLNILCATVWLSREDAETDVNEDGETDVAEDLQARVPFPTLVATAAGRGQGGTGKREETKARREVRQRL